MTVTAWQMLFDYAHVTAGQTVLIHGGAGNVGAYAVQLAKRAGLHVIATPPPPIWNMSGNFVLTELLTMNLVDSRSG